mmetsp:Transcript_115001/g.325730  ORF Transcript_115001/g.325730 Transcript_115001/m.325730 type:complete len:301 (-) Transcript_115001:275-1177(-)
MGGAGAAAVLRDEDDPARGVQRAGDQREQDGDRGRGRRRKLRRGQVLRPHGAAVPLLRDQLHPAHAGAHAADRRDDVHEHVQHGPANQRGREVPPLRGVDHLPHRPLPAGDIGRRLDGQLPGPLPGDLHVRRAGEPRHRRLVEGGLVRLGARGPGDGRAAARDDHLGHDHQHLHGCLRSEALQLPAALHLLPLQHHGAPRRLRLRDARGPHRHLHHELLLGHLGHGRAAAQGGRRRQGRRRRQAARQRRAGPCPFAGGLRPGEAAAAGPPGRPPVLVLLHAGPGQAALGVLLLAREQPGE